MKMTGFENFILNSSYKPKHPKGNQNVLLAEGFLLPPRVYSRDLAEFKLQNLRIKPADAFP